MRKIIITIFAIALSLGSFAQTEQRAFMTVHEYVAIRLGEDTRPRTAFENRMVQLYDWLLGNPTIRGRETANLAIREIERMGYDAENNRFKWGLGRSWEREQRATFIDEVTRAKGLRTVEDFRRQRERDDEIARQERARAELERRQRAEQERIRAEQQRRQDSIRVEQERVRVEERRRQDSIRYQEFMEIAQNATRNQMFIQARQSYLSALELKPENADAINARIAEVDSLIAERERKERTGCNFNTPGWGESLGTVSFATSQTWTIGNQTWSDAVTTTACQKTTFSGGSVRNFNADCRSNPRFPGDLFSWCAIYRFAELLCPYPWRVPTSEDFRQLDIAMGGTGESRINDTRFVTNNYRRIWGGQFSGGTDIVGTLQGQRQWVRYWSTTQIAVSHAHALCFNAVGGAYPRRSFNKNEGFSLRCVRDAE